MYDRMAIQFLLIAILNILVFLILIKKKKIDEIYQTIRLNLHVKSYIGFLSFGFLSLLVASNIIESLIVLSQFINFFIAYILILNLSKNSKINFLNIFISFTLIGLFLESYNINSKIYESIVTNGDVLRRSLDFRGFAGNPNISSFALAIKIPVVIYLIFKIKNIYKLSVLYMLLSFSTLTIFLLFSRAAILVMVLIVFFTCLFIILNRRKEYILKGAMFFAAIIVSAGLYSSLNDKNTSDIIKDRFSNVTSPQNDDSVNERLGFYKIATEDIINNPILGIGIGNWKLKSIPRANKFLRDYRVPYRAHNDFLEITAEIGIIGAVCFIYFIFYPFILSFRSMISKKELGLSFPLFLIIGVYIFDSLFNFPMQRPVNFMFLIFAFALFDLAKFKKLL